MQIGWNIEGEFREQIGLCVDEMYYATLSTSYLVEGQYIDLRDKTAKRPSFRRDISGYGRLFEGFPSQRALSRYVYHESLIYVVRGSSHKFPFFSSLLLCIFSMDNEI